MIDQKETLKNCIVMLGNIRVPMAEIDNIGIPICQVRNALIQIMNELDKPEEPEITIEPAEENVKMAGEQDGKTGAE